MKEEKVDDFVKNFKSTVGIIKKERPEIADAFLNFIRIIHRGGTLSPKEKELICLGISIYAGCEACIVLHTKSALEAGVTKDELLETCGVALVMGGSSSINYVSTAIEAFKEFSAMGK